MGMNLLLKSFVITMSMFRICVQYNVHLVPFSHQDLGWLRTIENYYYGTYQGTQLIESSISVRRIYQNLVKEMKEGLERKFVIGEQGYLMMWWKENNSSEKDAFRNMVKKNSIEILNGGIVSNDEATAHYDDIITQFEVGHEFVKTELQFIPRIGFQIDPFGHSKGHALLNIYLGFTHMLLVRIHFVEKQLMLTNKDLFFAWHPLGKSRPEKLLTLLYPSHYKSPDYTCWDDLVWCKDDSIGKFNNYYYKTIFDSHVKKMSSGLPFKESVQLFGDDFSFLNTHKYYENIDKLIDIFEKSKESTARIKYSTLNEYFEEITKLPSSLNDNINKFDKDFFPYSDMKGDVWTGFYSSQSELKYQIRESGRKLGAFQKFFSAALIKGTFNYLNDNKDEILDNLKALATIVGLCQHHDTITGTSLKAVSISISGNLSQATERIEQSFARVIADKLWLENAELFSCNLLIQENNCSFSKSDGKGTVSSFVLVVYNPGLGGKHRVQAKIPHENFTVLDYQNNTVKSQVICNFENNCTVNFFAEFQSIQTRIFIITNANSTSNKAVLKTFNEREKSEISLNLTNNVSIKVINTRKKDSVLFEISECRNGEHCDKFGFQIYYKMYPVGSSSGEYTFNPNNAKGTIYSTLRRVHFYQGDMLQRIDLEADDYTTEVTFFGNIYEKGIDVVTRLNPFKNYGQVTINIKREDIINMDTFYTDSNSLLEIPRSNNYYESFKQPDFCKDVEPSCNMYPMTSYAYIEDFLNRKSRMIIFSDRSQSATSQSKGELEIMIARRTRNDDAKGLPREPEDTDSLRYYQFSSLQVRHRILFTSKGDVKSIMIANEIDQPLQIYYSKINSQNVQNFDYLRERAISLSGENPNRIKDTEQIPPEIKIWLRPIDNENFILRFHNRGEANVELKNLLLRNRAVFLEKLIGSDSSIFLKAISETNLSGIEIWDDSLSFRSKIMGNLKAGEPNFQDYASVVLKSGEIRTFKVVLQLKKHKHYKK